MKVCTKCNAVITVPVRRAQCPDCVKARVKAWKERRKAEGRPVKSSPTSPEYQRAYQAEYVKNPANKARIAERMRQYAKDPALRMKHEARWKVRRALNSGRLTRQPCEVCGAEPAHGHHDDYSKPLDVRWLCPTHHREHHAKATP